MELRTYNREIGNAKQESSREFCGNKESIPVTARLHKALVKSNRGIMSLKRQDGGWRAESSPSRDTYRAAGSSHFHHLLNNLKTAD